MPYFNKEIKRLKVGLSKTMPCRRGCLSGGGLGVRSDCSFVKRTTNFVYSEKQFPLNTLSNQLFLNRNFLPMTKKSPFLTILVQHHPQSDIRDICVFPSRPFHDDDGDKEGYGVRKGHRYWIKQKKVYIGLD